MIHLLFTAIAFSATPCPKLYVPGAKAEGFLEQRLESQGLKLTKPKNWADFVRSEGLEEETKEFDELDQDIFLRRLEELPLGEIARLYPSIEKKKLKTAKEKVNPCAR